MRYLVGIALIAALALSLACGDDDNATTTATPLSSVVTSTTTQTAAPTGTTAATATAAATPTTASIVCTTNPDPASPSETAVDLPLPGDHVTSPITVAGQINAFEATFLIAIKDASGADITPPQVGHSVEGQVLSNFEQEPTFTVTAATPACLWVYQASAMDGSPQNVVQIPVTLEP